MTSRRTPKELWMEIASTVMAAQAELECSAERNIEMGVTYPTTATRFSIHSVVESENFL
jgi:hypothetical protein